MGDKTNTGKALVVLLIATVPASLFYGLVLCDLWAWFIVPVFAAPALTITQAVGVNILSSFFRHGLKRDEPETDDALSAAVQQIFNAFWFGAFFWAYGAAWHFFAGAGQ